MLVRIRVAQAARYRRVFWLPRALLDPINPRPFIPKAALLDLASCRLSPEIASIRSKTEDLAIEEQIHELQRRIANAAIGGAGVISS